MKLVILCLSLLVSAIMPCTSAHAEGGVYPEIKVLVDADRSFVNKAGGAAAAVKQIQALVAAVDAIYRTQLGLTVTLVGPHLWEGDDPFDRATDSTLLASFSAYAEANYRSSYRYDAAHLLVGSSLSGEGGIAYPASACGDPSSLRYAYGLSQPDLSDTYQFNPHVFAHELGHNLAAEHDAMPACAKETIMCQAQIGGAFSNASKAEISAYVAERTAAGCFASVPKVDPVSTVRVSVASAVNSLRFTVSGAQQCSALTVVGSPWRDGFSHLFGYLQIGAMTPAATASAKSSGILGLLGSKKLYIGALCDGQLAAGLVELNAKRFKTTRRSTSQILVLRSLQHGFRAARR